MEITCTTVYDQKAVTAMARGLRKTIRKKRNRRTRVFGCFVMILALLLPLLTLEEGQSLISLRTAVNWLVALGMLVVLIWEDWINGWFARKRMLPGMENATTLFTREGYTTVTEVGTTQWKYDNILLVAESRNYFVFVFSKSHAQVYDKNGLSGVSAEKFGAFLTEITGKVIEKI